jgi:hypothetical protein
MKKFLAIILMLCFAASALCITAFADDPAVIRVSGLKKGAEGNKDELVVIGSYSSFEEGWEKAIDTAESDEEMSKGNYERIVVDLLANWTSKKGGEFGSGDGFTYSNAIRFTSDTKITLNLNGFTIKRDLDTWKWNGEVIYVATDADVIINNGTITGGWSGGGAGGIHIDDDARVILNQVNVVGNIADDDDGGGIAVYDGALLIMNGGSISNNIIRADSDITGMSYDGLTLNGLGGGLYVEDSEVVLKNVNILNNQTCSDHHLGAAIYARYSKVTMTSCNVAGNGLDTVEEDFDVAGKSFDVKNSICAAYSIIDGYEADFIINDTEFTNNGAYFENKKILSSDETIYSAVIKGDCSSITMNGGKIENNNTVYLFIPEDSAISITNVHIINNISNVICGKLEQDSFFRRCTFNDNFAEWHRMYSFGTLNRSITFYDCDMGNSTYSNENNIKLTNTNEPDGITNDPNTIIFDTEADPILFASIFSEGSLTLIVAFAALIASIASIMVNVVSNKKRSASESAKSNTTTDSEEEKE